MGTKVRLVGGLVVDEMMLSALKAYVSYQSMTTDKGVSLYRSLPYQVRLERSCCKCIHDEIAKYVSSAGGGVATQIMVQHFISPEHLANVWSTDVDMLVRLTGHINISGYHTAVKMAESSRQKPIEIEEYVRLRLESYEK